MNKLEVLYEDNHVIVVIKPYNVLSQSDCTKDLDLLTIVKNYLKEKYHKPGNVYLGLVHRLDRPVGGVMVFAKSSKAASRLSNFIREHQFSKKYLAVVHGILDSKEGRFSDYLWKDDEENTRVTTKNKEKLSELEYRVLEEDAKEQLSLVEVKLITGRHHQIRVQFSSRNHPLYGDQRYGQTDGKQIALWAYSLSFPHPISKEILTFTYFPDVKHGAWKFFHF